MPTVLITGGNRGIGLQLVRQLKDRGYEVYATCRSASKELKDLAVNVIEGVDVSQESSMDKLKASLNGLKLDVLINSAGILERTSLEEFDLSSMNKQFQVNTLGPMRVVGALLGQMKSGGKILMITSRMGSIADNDSGGSYGYRMSKAALNAGSFSLAHDLKPRNIAVGIIHPGYVKTEMTGFSGYITPEESVQGILKRMDDLNISNTGTFWHQNGEVLPW